MKPQWEKNVKILVVDVGGSHVKCVATAGAQRSACPAMKDLWEGTGLRPHFRVRAITRLSVTISPYIRQPT